MVRRDDVVELCGGLIVLPSPGRPAVVGDVRAAIVPLDHAERVAGVDPQVVIVTVRRADLFKRAAAVGRFPEADVEDVDRVLVLGIGVDVRVVPGPLPERPIVVDPGPGGTAILRPENAAFFGFDHRPDPLRVHRRDRDADLAEGALGQARVAADLGPAVAAVGRLEQPTPRAAALHPPRHAAGLPKGGVDDPRIVRVEGDIDGARVLVPIKDILPGGATVQRAEDAAGRVGPKGVSENRRVDQVRVGGVDPQLADLAAVAQPDVGPALPCVGGLVDAVARRGVATNARLAGANVDDVGVGGGDGDTADRPGAEVLVGDRLPRHPAIHGLPNAAAGGAHVVHVGLARHPGHRGDPAAAVGTDRTPLQRIEQLLVVALATRRVHVHPCGGCDERKAEQQTTQASRGSHGRPSELARHGSNF